MTNLYPLARSIAGLQIPMQGPRNADDPEKREKAPIGLLHTFMAGKWSGRRDSNPRHSAWEADTLPAELLPLGRMPILIESACWLKRCLRRRRFRGEGDAAPLRCHGRASANPYLRVVT